MEDNPYVLRRSPKYIRDQVAPRRNTTIARDASMGVNAVKTQMTEQYWQTGQSEGNHEYGEQEDDGNREAERNWLCSLKAKGKGKGKKGKGFQGHCFHCVWQGHRANQSHYLIFRFVNVTVALTRSRTMTAPDQSKLQRLTARKTVKCAFLALFT